jgi:hypothetical protein
MRSVLLRRICRRLAVSCFGDIAQPSPELTQSVESAYLVVEGGIFPYCIQCLLDKDQGIRINAAGLLREISKHTQELSQVVIDHGDAEALVLYLSSDQNNEPLNAFMAIEFIASFSQSLTTGLINEGV